MLLVTGAAGYIGSAILRRLARMLPLPELAALARNGAKAKAQLPAGIEIRLADYDDSVALRIALRDVTRLMFVASDGAARDVLRHHANVFAAAVEAGIKEIVFTSIVDVGDQSPFYYAPVYRAAEQQLAETGIPATLLRCGLYSDFVQAYWLAPALPTGTVTLPAGEAQIAVVSRDDIAAAAAAILTGDDHLGRTYRLTGSTAHELATLVDTVNHELGAKIAYADCPAPDYLLQAWQDLSDPWPQAFSTMLASIRAGNFATTSDDIEKLTGRPAEDFASFLRRTQAKR
ncbi:MAG TPA: NAD(P)H-binding protein [Terriglobales bacterium]|nr:NAD(P)H-binding protein [Terriglobales bacterium]